jgi:hypothetical protein
MSNIWVMGLRIVYFFYFFVRALSSGDISLDAQKCNYFGNSPTVDAFLTAFAQKKIIQNPVPQLFTTRLTV